MIKEIVPCKRFIFVLTIRTGKYTLGLTLKGEWHLSALVRLKWSKYELPGRAIIGSLTTLSMAHTQV
jgi:hypothetical protein